MTEPTGPRVCEVLRQWRRAARLELKTVAAEIGIEPPQPLLMIEGKVS